MRYDVFMDKRIILIGGAPAVGKSFAARELSRRIGISSISTDSIRELMRGVVRAEDYPNLFYFTNPKLTAENFLTQHTPEEVVRFQNLESFDVWRGVQSLISTEYTQTDYVEQSFIIEGVAVLPELVSALPKQGLIKSVFLIDENIDRIRETIFTRGLWDDADKYSDDVKEAEVKWVVAFNTYIKEEAFKYNLPVIDIGDRGFYISEIEKLVE